MHVEIHVLFLVSLDFLHISLNVQARHFWNPIGSDRYGFLEVPREFSFSIIGNGDISLLARFDGSFRI